MPKLPKTMTAAVLTRYGTATAAITIEQRPMPRPKIGQVLVKIAASPINPSDLMFLAGDYGFTKSLPIVPGFEASGTVVAAGPGLLPALWRGKRVACAVQATGDGTWAEYAAVSATQCLPLQNDVTFEQGAAMLVNPFTAWALIGIARERRAKTVIQTAAGSALGRMLYRLGKRYGIDVIGVVRRIEQATELEALGMRVLCSTEPAFDSHLAKLCRKANATLAFDAVAGDTTARVAKSLAPGGKVIVYGGLSLKPASVSIEDLIFKDKSIEGFWLSKWFRDKGLSVILTDAPKVQRLIATDLRSEIRARYPISDIREAVADYSAHMSGGKVLIVP